MTNSTYHDAKSEVLGVKVSILDKEVSLEVIEEYVRSGNHKPFLIFTPNAEIITFAQKNPQFKTLLNSGNINLPDGMYVVWANKILNKLLPQSARKHIKTRLTGSDFVDDLSKFATQKGLTVGLLGGRNGVSHAALLSLQKKYPGLTGWAEEGPEVIVQSSKFKVQSYKLANSNGAMEQWSNELLLTSSIPIAEVARSIMERETDILLVALGHPKQEYLIDVLHHYFTSHHRQPIVLMSVGGAFDYISGRIRRAPLWMRTYGLEWLYRLVRQPWRLKRQLALEVFTVMVVKEYLKGLVSKHGASSVPVKPSKAVTT